eukprot:671187-Pleurochrysis_carterae.AAC.3
MANVRRRSQPPRLRQMPPSPHGRAKDAPMRRCQGEAAAAARGYASSEPASSTVQRARPETSSRPNETKKART